MSTPRNENLPKPNPPARKSGPGTNLEKSGPGTNLEKSSRRSRNRSEIVTIWWRDIPTQVNGLSGPQIEKQPLSHRFLWAAQRAAKKADLLDSHAFTRQTRRTSTPFDPVDDSLSDAVSLEAQRLELHYTDDLLTRLVEAGGLAKNTAAVARPRLRVVPQAETDS
jgi:Virulence factor